MSSSAKGASGTCFGPDGARYEAAGGSKQVIRYSGGGAEGAGGAGGAATVIADGIAGNDLVVGHNGNVYVTAPDGLDRPGKVWLIPAPAAGRSWWIQG